MVHDLIGYKKESTIDELNRNLKEMVNPYKKLLHGLTVSFKNNTKFPISRHLQKKAHLFRISQPKILSSISNAIDNLENLQDIDQLFTEQTHQKMNQKYKKVEPISAQEAFSEPIDYTHSVYSNHTARTAMLQGKQFYINYSRFCRISELMKGKLWVNTNNYDAQIMAMDGLSIMLYNENYESILADSMSA
jgi:signal transduction histidine kinase